MYLCGWRCLGMDGGHANSCVMGILNVFVNLGDQCGSKFLSCISWCLSDMIEHVLSFLVSIL